MSTGRQRVTDLPSLPRRSATAHKGNFGRVLVLAGSRGMSGAALLAGSAALRAGAGLVTVACPASVGPMVAVGEPCLMTLFLSEDADGRLAERAIEPVLSKRWDAIAVGPGLGQSKGVEEAVTRLWMEYEGPLVIDADGLGVLARTRLWRNQPRPNTIVTPHEGEFQRLMGRSADEPIVHRMAEASQLQQEMGCVVVLKGAGTLVVSPEMEQINQTGNPGMATGGTGDVLTGTILGLLGQGWSSFDAARLGVHLHGRAGDLAAQEKGEISLIARDVLEAIPRAFMDYSSRDDG